MAVTDAPDLLAGLDALERAEGAPVGRIRRAWETTRPKVGALAIALGLWQLVVLSGYRESYVLPGPAVVIPRLWRDLRTAELWNAVLTTMQRGLVGFALALAIGGVIGLLVSRFATLRAAVGSLITGLQTMPSIAWFPLSIVVFGVEESAITFVVVLGAAPSIANGLIHGIDHIPPNLLRLGDVLGARGVSRYRFVVIPAAMPALVSGLKQGWAFAWRSLMAGELIVIIAERKSLGFLLDVNRQLADVAGLISTMLVILAIGIVIDSAVFGRVERTIRKKRGLLVER